MKKTFIEIAVVMLFCLLYLLLPDFRTNIVIAFAVLAFLIIPAQLLLSVSFKSWINELSGRYSHLGFEERMNQIRSTFTGLMDAESRKLRWFYIYVHLFHQICFIALSISVVLIVFSFIYLGLGKSDPVMVGLHLMGAIISCFVGYFFINLLFPIKVRRERDEIFYLFFANDWKRRLYKLPELQEADEFTNAMSFYKFWLVGKSLQEREEAFKKFLNDLNKGSKNGPLFIFKDDGKVELVKIIDARALNKTLAAFLRYCIEEKKVLSDRVLKHSHRHLIRDVFVLGEIKNLTFLESERIKNVPVEYLKIYESASGDHLYPRAR